MIYTICALCACILLLLLLLLTPRLIVPEQFTDMAALIGQLSGARYAWYTVQLPTRIFGRCVRMLNGKKRRKEQLFSFEKWLRDNDYTVQRAVYAARKRKWRLLPQVHNQPRIIAVARYLVQHGLAQNYKELAKALATIQSDISLYWPELVALPDAICWVCCEQLYHLAAKSLAYRRAAIAAKRGAHGVVDHDAYLYYKYATGYPHKYADQVLSARSRFYNALLDNESKAKQYLSIVNAALRLAPRNLMRLSTVLPAVSGNEIGDLAPDTRLQYLGRIAFWSEKLNITEGAVVNVCNTMAKQSQVDFATVLFDPIAVPHYIKYAKVRLRNGTVGKQRAYIAAVVALSLVAAAVPYILLRNYLALVAMPLLWLIASVVIQSLLQRILPRGETIDLRMGYGKVPDDARTIVVVARYIDSVDTVTKAVQHLRQLACKADDQNITYCMLVDLPAANEPWREQDEEILRALQQNARQDGMLYALRKRVKADRYVAWERKRGAIMDLFEMLQTGNTDKFRYLSFVPANYRYAVLLDDDSRLMPNGVLDAVNCMLHPANNRYDIMTFEAATNPYSVDTLFATRYLHGVPTGYPIAVDFYERQFGTALYCGKAIVRIDRFWQAMHNRLPDNRILSHDLLEGALLCTGSTHRVVFEDAPRTFAAHAMRLDRWQRGDVLLLPYLARVGKNREGKNAANTMQPIYRFLLLHNAIYTLHDAAVLLCIFLGVLTGQLWLTYVALGAVAMPFVWQMAALLRAIPFRRARYTAKSMVRLAGETIERYLFVPFYAWRGTIVFFTTVFRSLFSKKSMLIWTPFFRIRNGANVLRNVGLFVPGKLALAVLAILSNNAVFMFCAGAYWLLTVFWYFPFELKRKALSTDYRASLRALVDDTYRYFCTFAHGGIIMDTVQVFPPETSRAMSSPTDMGFSVLAHTCALLLGAKTDACLAHMKACLGALEKCRKWHGHLYNWYSCEGEVLGEVVSTVDSANFVACLLTAKQICLQLGFVDLAKRCGALANADFGVLYDAERNMLVIAYYPKEKRSEGYYDTLASEARLAYLLAVADGVPISAYYGLARDITYYRGNTVLSWGGTAFEYLLPRIFLRPPRGSLLRNSEINCAYLQVANGDDGLMGVSESCCKGFNDQMRYRYQANGLAKLALHPDCGEKVFSPYAAALVAQYLPDKGALTLARMQQAGMGGEYGLYEAIQDGQCLRTYMAHHQGMLLAALTNVLTKDALCQYFMRDERVAAATLLMAESQPQSAVPFRSVKRIVDQAYSANVFVYPSDTRAAHVLVNGDTRAVLLSDGRQEVYIHGNLVGGIAVGRGYSADRWVGIRKIGEDTIHYVYDTRHCGKGKFEVSGGYVIYRNDCASVYEEIRLLPDGSGLVYDLCLANDAEQDVAYEVSMVQSIALCERDAYIAHRAFCDMFVVTDIDGAIVAYRRTQEGKNTNRTIWSVHGMDNVRYTTNRRNAIRRNNAEVLFRYDTEFADKGEVIYPCAAMTGTCVVPKRSNHHIYCFCQMSAASVADIVNRNEQWYQSRILPYYGMVECLSECAKLVDKYATKNMAVMLASCLLDSYTADACRQIEREQPLVLPYVDSVRQDIDSALCVRLLSSHIDARLSVPDVVDNNVALCARIAGSVSSGYANFIVRDAPYEKLPMMVGSMGTPPHGMFESGEGCFVSPLCYAVRPFGRQTVLPYANVVSNGIAGFVLTENGGGFLYGSNSRQNKWTMWHNDAIMDSPTHYLLAVVGDKFCRLNDARYCRCLHGADTTVYTTYIGDNEVSAQYRVVGGCVHITVLQKAEPLPIVFAFYPLLDWRENPYCYIKKASGKSIVIANAVTNHRMTLSADHAKFFADIGQLAAVLKGEKPILERVGLVGCIVQAKQAEIWLGDVPDKNATHYRVTPPAMLEGNCALNLLMQGLWRQTVNSRLMARTGLYQCGGAYGYRDQLQDALAYMYGDPSRVKELLLVFAAHQYAEGDVMHWWHPPKTGVRTKVTDDRLFLCFAVAKYIKMTGDKALLDVFVPFLASAPLDDNTASRYETPAETKPYSMREHIKRAVNSVLRYGKHDLLKVGGGDWNDGINRIGLQGKGESVWLSMFAYMVLQEVGNLIPEWQDWLGIAMRRIKKGIAGAFVSDRFAAYYTDDDKWLGNGVGHCGLYLLPQAFASFCGAVDARVASVAINTAKRLVDYDSGTVALFDPPFDSGDNVGYIAAYPRGVRENGGQYTHAVAWFIKGLLAAGETEYAYEILQMINPIQRCTSRKESETYGAEPYVLAADVYRNGSAGWTWYTGSASWLQCVILEDMFGVHIADNKLYLRPNLPKALADSTLYLHWQGTQYRIRYQFGDTQRLTVGQDRRALDYVDMHKQAAKVDVYCLCKR